MTMGFILKSCTLPYIKHIVICFFLFLGYYCEFNEDPKACPNTTFSYEEGATNFSTCEPCPAGYWCNIPGMYSKMTYDI